MPQNGILHHLGTLGPASSMQAEVRDEYDEAVVEECKSGGDQDALATFEEGMIVDLSSECSFQKWTKPWPKPLTVIASHLGQTYQLPLYPGIRTG